MKIIPEANWKEDMKVFRTAAAKYYAGDLKRAEYKGISGKFGSYAQKGDKPLSMLRLRMPAGRLTPKKMAFIADSVRKYAINKLKSLDNIIIYNETADAGIITINVKGVFPQDEASYLNSKGICVRSGEHCAKLLKDLLKTVGTVRISFYFYNTFEEIDTLYEALKNGGDFLDAYFN